MKKLIIFGALAFASLFSAQESQKGKTFISGNLGYNSTSVDNSISSTNKTLSIAPQIGYYISNDVAIGLGIGYQESSYTANGGVIGNYKTKRSGFFISPFVRKYWSLGEKLNFFGQLSASYSSGNEEVLEPVSLVSKSKISSYGLNIAPGLEYTLNKNWALLTTLGSLGFNSVKPENANATNNFNFGVDLENVGFGAKYTF